MYAMKTHKEEGAVTHFVLSLCTRWSRMVPYTLRPF